MATPGKGKDKEPASDDAPAGTTSDTDVSPGQAAAQPAQVQWDMSQALSRYANAANVTTIRDEVSLFLGIHDAGVPGRDRITVSVGERVILPPLVAKQLALLLTQQIAEFERQHGEIPTS